MKQLITAVLLTVASGQLMAQESHYQRALRSQDTEYGLTQEPHFNGSGMYWSRTRNVDDVEIINETKEEADARRQQFIRLCRLAYDAYDASDWRHTIIYGDSALQTHFHTPDLYFFMAISSEKIGFYDEADWGYRKALASGYPGALSVYNDFKVRQKQRKQADKQRKKEEKRKAKAEKKGLKND